jgi:hypothetical protein
LRDAAQGVLELEPDEVEVLAFLRELPPRRRDLFEGRGELRVARRDRLLQSLDRDRGGRHARISSACNSCTSSVHAGRRSYPLRLRVRARSMPPTRIASLGVGVKSAPEGLEGADRDSKCLQYYSRAVRATVASDRDRLRVGVDRSLTDRS